MVRSRIAMVTTWINAFPPKRVIANIYKPRLIIGVKKLDWKKDLRIEFGQYYQVNEKPHHLNNVNTERTTGSIVLNSANIDQGCYRLMRLIPGKLL